MGNDTSGRYITDSGIIFGIGISVRGSYGSPYASFGGNNRSTHAFITWIDGDVGYISNTVFDGFYGNLMKLDIMQNSINFLWLRSPGTDWGVYAYLVSPSGDVNYSGINYDVSPSYGRLSPDSFMYYNYTSFYIKWKDGSMITYAVEYSYGRKKITCN